jgi:hypothetical protein
MSGYNYACIYDYTTYFYETSRFEKPAEGEPTPRITPERLADADVLVLKCPTEPYTDAEIDAIVDWVDAGGGLMLVGEHTDVFGTGRHLNAVARRFGFAFRYDCVFGIDSFFDQLYAAPPAPHPIVRHLPPMYFATSCSIAPGASAGRAPIVGTGLKNLPADYHPSNFYPQAEDRADMRYGAFVQLWTARHGKGRVVAFSDSTIFSNFSTFEPGKAELWLGMVEWLNRGPASGGVRILLGAAGLVVLAAGLWLARPVGGVWVLLLAAGLAGWAAGAGVVGAWHARAMPAPEVRADRAEAFTQVLVDRTTSDIKLSKGGFIGGREEGFGIFERWLLRLGYFTRRDAGPAAVSDDVDLVLVARPTLDVPDAWRDRLVEYVRGGGRLLVLDWPGNTASTANSILYPFGLELDRRTNLAGDLRLPEGLPAIPVQTAAVVRKIEHHANPEPLVPIATLGRRFTSRGPVHQAPVAATIRFGEGTVTVVGFGKRFTDDEMGVTGDVEPDEALRAVYEVQFRLVRGISEDRIPTLDASATESPSDANGGARP